MSNDEVTFQSRINGRRAGIDFMMSNCPRDRLFDEKDISGVWSWALSDHRPIGYGIEVKETLLTQVAKPDKLVK